MKIFIGDWFRDCEKELKPYHHGQEIEVEGEAGYLQIVQELYKKGLKQMLSPHGDGNASIYVSKTRFDQRG
jgi:hypothetical protein